MAGVRRAAPVALTRPPGIVIRGRRGCRGGAGRGLLLVATALILPAAAACAQEPSRAGNPPAAQADSARIEADLGRIRTATQAFRSVDAATAAGYAAVTGCIDNGPEGAMGYHHQNEALLDDRIEVERPEMLVFERLPDGAYRLNGVEYIVPFSAHPMDREPPTVMGQALKRAPSLGIWYRHVWVWLENPSGLFADWHPGVSCADDGSGGGGG